jgi:omega-6 fatty acid desaturase (delta-12 desaturase)
LVLLATALSVVPFLCRLAWWQIAVLWIAAVYSRTFCAFIQHNHNHLPTFNGTIENRALDVLLSLNTGYASAIWQLHHNLGHHRHYLDWQSDVAALRHPRTGHVMSRFAYAVRGNLRIHADSLRIARAIDLPRHRHLATKLVVEVALQIALTALFLWRSPVLGVLFFVIPNAFTCFMVWWESYPHHSGVPGTHVYDGSITVESRAYNSLTFNIGHHTAHHQKPTLHWSLLPQQTARIREHIPASCLKDEFDTAGGRLLGSWRRKAATARVLPAAASLPRSSWQKSLAPYQSPSLRKALGQLLTSVPPFFLSWAAAYVALVHGHSFVSSAACLLATGFLVRIYIIQHDCGHRSFFRGARANDTLGCLLSLITLLPYFRWRYDHALHHASSGNLTRRGSGDIWTMTRREYLEATPREQLKYRLLRNPLVLFGLGPFVLFVLWQRIPDGIGGRRTRRSVHVTNIVLASVSSAAAYWLGWGRVLFVHGIITLAGATVAVWLFYVQHQFEAAYWEKPPAWSYEDAALFGASWYRLPKILQWFTGNIGLHHVHHLNPKIPNYELQRCLEDNSFLQSATALSLGSAFRSISLRLWDERTRKLVGWLEADVPPFTVADAVSALWPGRRPPPSFVSPVNPSIGNPPSEVARHELQV